ncbi:hypothetical protein SAMN04487888_106257 [Eubacterium callanderi]|nr:hypothetical protein SAMN04487888_106257 [Eubacterium callanderi]
MTTKKKLLCLVINIYILYILGSLVFSAKCYGVI